MLHLAPGIRSGFDRDRLTESPPQPDILLLPIGHPLKYLLVGWPAKRDHPLLPRLMHRKRLMRNIMDHPVLHRQTGRKMRGKTG